MTSQFATMELDADIASTSTTTGIVAAFWDRLPSTLALERPCEAVTSAGSWSYALVGQCFSRMRRAQFDEEHQRSLLSCHSTDESDRSDGYSFPEDAMLELRRRIMKDESLSRKPTFAKDLDYEYPVQVRAPMYLSAWMARALVLTCRRNVSMSAPVPTAAESQARVSLGEAQSECTCAQAPSRASEQEQSCSCS